MATAATTPIGTFFCGPRKLNCRKLLENLCPPLSLPRGIILDFSSKTTALSKLQRKHFSLASHPRSHALHASLPNQSPLFLLAPSSLLPSSAPTTPTTAFRHTTNLHVCLSRRIANGDLLHLLAPRACVAAPTSVPSQHRREALTEDEHMFLGDPIAFTYDKW